jgi:hypothetical protein
MRTPSEFELDQLMHEYDPVKAHQYYLRTRKLKGRKKGSGVSPSNLQKSFNRAMKSVASKKDSPAKAKQRRELKAVIQRMENKLQKLEALITKKAREEASENRKSKAKKERAAKEKDKPKSAAEKAEAARENKKYRDKHKQELKTEARQTSGKSGGSKSKSTSSGSEASIDDLKALATRVRGRIAIAKQKLAAL